MDRIALEHLFLKGWDSAREVDAYPPAVGAFAVYRKDDFYGHLDFAAGAYHSLEEDAVNPVFKVSGGGGGGGEKETL